MCKKDIENLKKLIEKKRLDLHKQLAVKGLKETVKISQELDGLLNDYNKIVLQKNSR